MDKLESDKIYRHSTLQKDKQENDKKQLQTYFFTKNKQRAKNSILCNNIQEQHSL